MKRRIFRRRANDIFVTVAGVIAAALVFAGLFWAGANVPCGVFKFEPAAKVPARCLKHFA